MSRGPVLEMMLHYVMPDMTCRAAIVTKEMGLAVNLAVLPNGPNDHEAHEMFRHPHVHRLEPIVHVEGVSPMREIEHVSAAEKLEHDHTSAEQARYDAEMAAAQTDEERAAVSPVAAFTPPDDVTLAALEDQQEELHLMATQLASVGTYHTHSQHDVMVSIGRELAVRRAARELKKAEAEHGEAIELAKPEDEAS